MDKRRCRACGISVPQPREGTFYSSACRTQAHRTKEHNDTAALIQHASAALGFVNQITETAQASLASIFDGGDFASHLEKQSNGPDVGQLREVIRRSRTASTALGSLLVAMPYLGTPTDHSVSADCAPQEER